MAIPAVTVAAAGSAAYAALALLSPEHIARALSADPDRRVRGRRIGRALGARDLAVSLVVLRARTPRVRTFGAVLRVALDLADAVLLPRATDSARTRRAIVAVTLGSAALHTLAVVHDRRTAA